MVEPTFFALLLIVLVTLFEQLATLPSFLHCAHILWDVCLPTQPQEWQPNDWWGWSFPALWLLWLWKTFDPKSCLEAVGAVAISLSRLPCEGATKMTRTHIFCSLLVLMKQLSALIWLGIDRCHSPMAVTYRYLWNLHLPALKFSERVMNTITWASSSSVWKRLYCALPKWIFLLLSCRRRCIFFLIGLLTYWVAFVVSWISYSEK